MKLTDYQYHFDMDIIIIMCIVYIIGYWVGKTDGFLECKKRIIRRR